MADCKECLHNGVCYMQEVAVDIERVLKDFGCDDYKPTADVVEVRHGYWKPTPDGLDPIRCSECNMPAPYRYEENFTHDLGLYPYKANICPDCGAKMDGKGEG